jgi:hypothetical protein
MGRSIRSSLGHVTLHINALDSGDFASGQRLQMLFND